MIKLPMRWTRALCLVALSVCTVSGLEAGPAGSSVISVSQAPAAGYASDSILVRFKPSANASNKAQARGLVNAVSHRSYGLVRGLENMRLKAGQGVTDAVDKLSRLPFVEYAEPDYIVQKTSTTDPFFRSLYAIDNTGQSVAGISGTPDADMDVLEAWNTLTGSPDLIIAVIDEGVDYTHPDLAANMWVNPGEIPANGVDDDNNGVIDDVHGYDAFGGDGDPMPGAGESHGTHVAGTICAVGNNGTGIVGVVQQCRIMSLRFLGPNGGSISDGIASLDYAVAMGATISNNSWGGGGFSQAMYNALSAAKDADHVFLAAAGNSGTNNDSSAHYPSNYNLPNVVSVAATDNNDLKASFSNYGATSVDIGAPGVNILSTVLDGEGDAGAVATAAASYVAVGVSNSPTGSASGTLVNCGLGEVACAAAGGSVCLIERGIYSFEEKAVACQQGGGSAAVIYNNDTSAISWTLNSPTAVTIPAVGVSQADGASLLSAVGTTVSVALESSYAYYSGTSMATPNTTGVVALIRSQNPGWNYQQVIDHLYATARPAASMAGITTTGKIANAAAAVATVEPPSPPAAPSGLMVDSVTETSVSLSWADNADNEAAFVIERNGQELSQTVGANVTSFTDSGLAGATTYSYRVKARNTAGDSAWVGPVDATTDTPPPFQTVVASSETTLAGSVLSGSYLTTHDADGSDEVIRERESGGRKNSRYSYMDHRWALNAPAGAAVLTVTGSADNSSDGDSFVVAYSTGGAFTDVCTLAVGSPAPCSASFTIPSAGAVTVRVTDTNQSPGSRALDSVAIDQIMMTVESGGGPVTAPAAPTGLSGDNSTPGVIALTWIDNADNETQYLVERSDDSGASWSEIGSLGPDATAFEDASVASLTTYQYRASARNSAGSGTSTVLEITSAEQEAPSITLTSATGYKTKGWQNVDASWDAGGAAVTLYRNSTSVYEGTASSTTDGRISKGGGVYDYQVCPQGAQPDTADCSNIITVVF